jgi:hypothetical protein
MHGCKVLHHLSEREREKEGALRSRLKNIGLITIKSA